MTDAGTDELEAARLAVIAFSQRMARDHLVVGTSGNVSVRSGDLIAVTPSGVDYEAMTAADVCVVDRAGNQVAGSLRPTTELPMHLACYARHRAAAVVHTHSTAATALSLLCDEVPAVHYQLGMFGGSVRVAPYATYGTDELATQMSAALTGRSGCILRNHGTITIGNSLAAAYDRARQLEWLCQVWFLARSVGEPVLLPAGELARVTGKFAGYGQPEGRGGELRRRADGRPAPVPVTARVPGAGRSYPGDNGFSAHSVRPRRQATRGLRAHCAE